MGILARLLYNVIISSQNSGTLGHTDAGGFKGYRRRNVILNASEQALYFELKKQLPVDYHVFPNMRIADIIDAIDGRGFYYRRNKILPKHVDFVICDEKFKPLMAIELNGLSHTRVNRIKRDLQVSEIFAQADMPLIMLPVGGDFVENVAKIKEKLSLSPAYTPK